MRAATGIALSCFLCASCFAQVGVERPGCTATLDGANFEKPQSGKRYSVTVRWRRTIGGADAIPQYVGNGTGEPLDWHPVGTGWIALDYTANLYYRVTYGPESGYTAEANIPDLGYSTCTWK